MRKCSGRGLWTSQLYIQQNIHHWTINIQHVCPFLIVSLFSAPHSMSITLVCPIRLKYSPHHHMPQSNQCYHNYLAQVGSCLICSLVSWYFHVSFQKRHQTIEWFDNFSHCSVKWCQTLLGAQWPRQWVAYTLRKKVLQSTFFWCSRLSQIEDSIQYLEGPNSTWKDHVRNLGVRLVLPGTE